MVCTFLDVPPEIREEVAVLSGRQVIARLCAVSRAFYSEFMLQLYEMTTQPQLTYDQCNLLIRTLSAAHLSVLKPRPTRLIKNVSFSGDLPRCRTALQNLVDISSSGQLIRGAMLRELEWNFSDTKSLDIVLTPRYFPNLKHISINVGRVENLETSFNFIGIPGLEKLEFSLVISVDCDQSLPALGKALASLSSSSPFLHALKLEFRLYSSEFGTIPQVTTPSWDLFAGLIKSVNEMRFAGLTSLELSVELVGFTRDDHQRPRPNFLPLLLGNPSLTKIKLDVDEMRFIPAQASVLTLPRLRSFAGSAEQCAVVSAYAPELEQLSILFEPLGRDSDARLFTPNRFPSNVGSTIRRLTVRAVERHFGYPDFVGALAPQSLNCLALAFPNVTHLDIRLREQSKISEYRDGFVALPSLEYLRMYRSIYLRSEQKYKSPRVIFSAKRYATRINETLCPYLPRLSEVHMFLLGRRASQGSDIGCPCCDDELWLEPYHVEYRFGREGGTTELALVEEHISEPLEPEQM
ncbi:hypothetical protein MVEN_00904800 [Mycena venus]|uniref:Uncharacterized protein n=1 Tax=Mycena venus TaxID=2733690 RepID=A0A8H7D1H0_9AGAR|nr:hypothetical protein MVEN_00904800 [Mycena venus]